MEFLAAGQPPGPISILDRPKIADSLDALIRAIERADMSTAWLVSEEMLTILMPSGWIVGATSFPDIDMSPFDPSIREELRDVCRLLTRFGWPRHVLPNDPNIVHELAKVLNLLRTTEQRAPRVPEAAAKATRGAIEQPAANNPTNSVTKPLQALLDYIDELFRAAECTLNVNQQTWFHIWQCFQRIKGTHNDLSVLRALANRARDWCHRLGIANGRFAETIDDLEKLHNRLLQWKAPTDDDLCRLEEFEQIFLLFDCDHRELADKVNALCAEGGVDNAPATPPANAEAKTAGEAPEVDAKATPLPKSEPSGAISQAQRGQPSEDAFKAYRLSIATGKNQTELAEILTTELKRPIGQGQVSRWLDKVKEWLEAENVLPDLFKPLDKQPTAIDPEVLDLGKRQDRRTERQRDRRNDDD